MPAKCVWAKGNKKKGERTCVNVLETLNMPDRLPGSLALCLMCYVDVSQVTRRRISLCSSLFNKPVLFSLPSPPLFSPPLLFLLLSFFLWHMLLALMGIGVTVLMAEVIYLSKKKKHGIGKRWHKLTWIVHPKMLRLNWEKRAVVLSLDPPLDSLDFPWPVGRALTSTEGQALCQTRVISFSAPQSSER